MIFARERLGAVVLAGPFLVLGFAAIWGEVGQSVPDTWPVGIILAGFFAGLLTRLLGRGARPIFYAASVVLFLLAIVLAARLFGVFSIAFVSMKLLIVVMGIGISAALSLVSFGMSREERWSLRDNRGLADPEGPGGLFAGAGLPLGALFASSLAAGLLGGATTGYEAPDDHGSMPVFGEPSVQFWEEELRRNDELVEEARRNGVGLGLEGSDKGCIVAVEARHAECELNLCKAQRPYVLAGCLETAQAVRDEEEIRW